MGWGLDKKGRDTLISQCDAVFDPSSVPALDTIVVDATALMYICSAGKFKKTAVLVGANMLKKVLITGSETAMLFFDVPSRAPPVRARLHKTRYPQKSAEKLEIDRAKGMVIIAGRSFKPGAEPYTSEELATFEATTQVCWARLLANAEGKCTATKLLIAGLMYSAQATVRAKTFRLVLSGGPDEVTLFYPRSPTAFSPELATGIEAIKWGEADNRVSAAVQAFSKLNNDARVVVWTIDTDMVLQLIAVDLAGFSGTLVLNLIKSDPIDMMKLRQAAGSTLDERRATTALLLCAKGCDYNNGFTTFGYVQKAFVDAAMSELRIAPFVTTRADGGIIFDLKLFLDVVRSIPRRSVKRYSPLDLRTELEGICTTLGLFCLVGSDRDVPGPGAIHIGCVPGHMGEDPLQMMLHADSERAIEIV